MVMCMCLYVSTTSPSSCSSNLWERLRQQKLLNSLKEVFHVFGVPEYIHSDNGKQFVSETFKTFAERYGTKHVKTAFYSPQANAAERVNRSVLQIIRSYIKDNQKNWDNHVSDAAFALRSVVHSAIGTSPYSALFGIPMIQHAASYELYRKLGALRDSDSEITTGKDNIQLIRKNYERAEASPRTQRKGL